MAKQPDEHDRPQPEEDVLGPDDRIPEAGKPPTAVSRKPNTQLAPLEDPATAPPVRKPAAPTMLGKPDEEAPAVPKTAAPTMLAKDEPSAPPLVIPNMSLDEPGAGSSVFVAEPLGDENAAWVVEVVPESEEGAPPSSILDVIPVTEDESVLGANAGEPADLGAARPHSDIFVGEFAEAPSGQAGSSEILDAQPISVMQSDVLGPHVVSEVLEAQPVSEVQSALKAAPPAAYDDADSVDLAGAAPTGAEALDLFSIEEEPLASDEDASGVLEVEVLGGSSIVEAEEAGGSSIFEAEAASEIFEAEAASEVDDEVLGEVEEVAAEASSAEVVSAEVENPDVSSATRKGEAVLGDEKLPSQAASGSQPAQPESPVFFEEDIDEAAPASARAAEDATEEADVLDIAEAQAGGSSAINWDEVGEGSSALKQAEAASYEQTVAFEAIADEEDSTEGSSSAVDLGKAHAGKIGAGSSGSGIDPVAEALESGIDLEDEAASDLGALDEPSVEFDELLTDEAPPKARAKKKGAKGLTDAGTDEEDIFSAGAAEGSGAEIAEAEAASAVEAEDAEPVFDDEDIEPAFAEDEEEVVPKSKKKAKAKRETEEDEEFAEADATEEVEVPETRKGAAPRPRRLVPVLGGTALGMLLVVGAAAGVWYFAPDYLEQMPRSPNAKPLPPPVIAATPLEKAGGALAQRNYPQVLAQLEGKTGPGELGALGEARWLQYVKEQADKKEPLKENDEKVKQAKKELVEADKDHPLLPQINKTFEAMKLKGEVAKLEESDKTVQDLRGILEKNKVVEEGAKLDELPKALGQVLDDKEKATKQLDGIAQALAEGKFIEDKDKLDVVVFQKILKDLGDKQTTLGAVNKLLEDAKIKEAGDKGVEKLLVAKKDADDKLSDVNKVLGDEKVKDEGAKGVTELAASRDKLRKDRDDLDATIKSAVDELADAKIVPAAGDPRKLLVAGTKLARARAESPLAIPLGQLGGSLNSLGASVAQLIESGLVTGRLATELSYYKVREPFIESPKERLETHIALLHDRTRHDPKETAAVLRETEWLLSKEAASTPEARAKAHYAAGLALRNQEKYEEARKSLTEALKEAKALPKPGPWRADAAQALKELTDPAVYYLPRIQRELEAGHVKQALAESNTALKVIPDNAALLAERAEVRLDEARKQGKISPEAQKLIQADAEAALKDAGAPAAFVLGQLEEDLGNLEGAEKKYREALKANQDSKGSIHEGNRIRIALARLLQRDRTPAAVAPAEPAEPRKEEKAEEKTSSLYVPMHPLTGLVLAMTLGAQPAEEEENPAATARLRESIQLAEELIRSDDPKAKGQGHVLLGQALSKQGKRTEGLREVAKGMALLFPGLTTQEMGKLLNEHPAFQHPDATKEPNPVIAERFYGLGLHHYWEHRYPEAEAQFKQAVGYFDKDARYQYFLGLSQLAQKTQVKRDAAYFSFEKGARLEAQGGQRTIDEINASLERVQGGLRQMLNGFRIRVLAKAPPE
jgi:hypothetical protein